MHILFRTLTVISHDPRILFYREVHEGCLPHDRNNSDKAVNNLPWIRSLKSIAEHYILLCSLFHTIKKVVLFFMRCFQPPYTELMKFPTR